jgi:hypothetical protein
VLDRVLDKGLVIAGDIKINLANVELLTIQVRLLVCSIDKAEQIGLNWWRTDPRLTLGPHQTVAGEVNGQTDVERRLSRIEQQLELLVARADPAKLSTPQASDPGSAAPPTSSSTHSSQHTPPTHTRGRP